jgi:phosphoglycerate dehydrogenase-like enzyme
MRRVLLMYGLFEPSPRHLDWLAGQVDEVVVAQDEAHAIEAARSAEVIFGHRYLRQCLPGATRLRWVQSTAGGLDRLPCRELAAQGVILTRVTFTAPAIARHALTLAWSFNRALPAAWKLQSQGNWQNELPWLPHPRAAAVFGYGSIGQQLARLLQNDGIDTHVVTRSGRLPEGAPVPSSIRTLTGAAALLPQVDWCFLALPDNAEADGLFDTALLRKLPAHAVLVNVGRGRSVVTPDLCAVLASGHLGGAGLDVVHPLPAGPNDPLWKTPRLVLTPHVAAHYAERPAQMEAFAESQLVRYLAGQPLENRADFPG